jgi:DNA-binding HxlR family transcriptional regulator
MSKYGQYCPVAKALEIVGDRWTLLIIRDLLTGAGHFNELERGLPGISRALLASRLRQLQRAGLVEKQLNGPGRQTTAYKLTQAGRELSGVIGALRAWGEAWAFGDPAPEELDPVLLMWWMRKRVEIVRLPPRRVVAQFDFHGFDFHGSTTVSFWLILTRADVTLCLTDPGYEIQVLVTADLAAFYRVWGGRLSYREALATGDVCVDGQSSLVRAFPHWFGWGGTTQTNREVPVVGIGQGGH